MPMTLGVVLIISGFGTFETCRRHRAMSEFEGEAENICSHRVLLSLTHSRHQRGETDSIPNVS
jgi:hypothetical protein